MALALSTTYVLLVYPAVGEDLGAGLDPDRYGPLGYGLWKAGSLSYYPETEPTVRRGPAYPFFIAVLLAVTDDGWPEAVQLGQCGLFAATCGLVFITARRLWNRRVATIAASVCAVHPFVIWYTSRIWTEALAIFLFTAVIASSVRFSMKPGAKSAALVGILLGSAALTKSTFLPLLVVVPALLAWNQRGSRSASLAGLALAFGLVVVGPWTARNWRLTGAFVPVHVLGGYNILKGDIYVDHWTMSPLSYASLQELSLAPLETFVSGRVRKDLPHARQEVARDRLWLGESLQRYREEPLFLMRKVTLNAALYWTLGETPIKTLVIAALQLPVLVLAVPAAVRTVRRQGIASSAGLPVTAALVFYLVHLPIFAFGRLSVVLVPTLLMYAASGLPGASGPSSVQRPRERDAL